MKTFAENDHASGQEHQCCSILDMRVQYRQMVIDCAAMCSKHSFFVRFPLLLQHCTLLPSSRHLEARQLEEPVLGVHVLQNCSVLQDDSAPFTQEGQVVDSRLVYLLLLILVLRLVVPQVSLSQHEAVFECIQSLCKKWPSYDNRISKASGRHRNCRQAS